ncbi:hypothetical protein [Methanimicrococcus hacksteinii]|uniref:hypothetical protein n=1 Tax=Methanimicrococcus hacksteinii TaxID=3028293 RepID=UPI00298F1A08|nr:hypothetical protein [Methanimicrococcus sp. At1]
MLQLTAANQCGSKSMQQQTTDAAARANGTNFKIFLKHFPVLKKFKTDSSNENEIKRN